MGAFAAGQVVLLPFPFSDLTGNKLRPALLLASVDRGDWIACQITSNPYADPRAIELENHAFASGGLQRISYIRPSKIIHGQRVADRGFSRLAQGADADAGAGHHCGPDSRSAESRGPHRKSRPADEPERLHNRPQALVLLIGVYLPKKNRVGGKPSGMAAQELTIMKQPSMLMGSQGCGEA